MPRLPATRYGAAQIQACSMDGSSLLRALRHARCFAQKFGPDLRQAGLYALFQHQVRNATLRQNCCFHAHRFVPFARSQWQVHAAHDLTIGTHHGKTAVQTAQQLVPINPLLLGIWLQKPRHRHFDHHRIFDKRQLQRAPYPAFVRIDDDAKRDGPMVGRAPAQIFLVPGPGGPTSRPGSKRQQSHCKNNEIPERREQSVHEFAEMAMKAELRQSVARCNVMPLLNTRL